MDSLPIKVLKENSEVDSLSDELTLVIIKKGTGVFELNQMHYSFIGPALFCLNETEAMCFEKYEGIAPIYLKFHPNFVNKTFDFENIRGYDEAYDSNSREKHWLKPFLVRDESYKGYLDIGPTSAIRVEEILSQIETALENKLDGYRPCRTRSFLIELLVFIERLYMDIGKNSTLNVKIMNEDINEIITYMNGHFHEQLRISDLSERFSISRTTLNERFKKAIGFTINAYLIQLRLKSAMFLLVDTDLPIIEIMYRVGFNDYPYFIKSFKKYLAQSPSEYRKINSK